jgi:hypothetical protein
MIYPLCASALSTLVAIYLCYTLASGLGPDGQTARCVCEAPPCECRKSAFINVRRDAVVPPGSFWDPETYYKQCLDEMEGAPVGTKFQCRWTGSVSGDGYHHLSFQHVFLTTKAGNWDKWVPVTYWGFPLCVSSFNDQPESFTINTSQLFCYPVD